MSRYSVLLTSAFAVCATIASAQPADYSTNCIVAQGQATGFIAVRQPRALSFSGPVRFYTYDANGSRVAEINTISSVTTHGNDLFRVGSVPVAAHAATCAIDVSSAIGPAPAGAGIRPYMTTCEILDNRARSYVHLTSTTSTLSFSGRVYFHFFDESGDFLYQDLTLASTNIIGRNREFVAEIAARRSAHACLLDITEAIR